MATWNIPETSEPISGFDQVAELRGKSLTLAPGVRASADEVRAIVTLRVRSSSLEPASAFGGTANIKEDAALGWFRPK